MPAYDYNFLGLERYTVAGTQKLAPGKSTIRFEFAYDGGGLGKGGMGTLYVNDKKVGEGRIARTQPDDLLRGRNRRRRHRPRDTGRGDNRFGSQIALHRSHSESDRRHQGRKVV